VSDDDSRMAHEPFPPKSLAERSCSYEFLLLVDTVVSDR
jgi:hypothetical protein